MLDGLPWPAQIGVTGAGYLGFITVCLIIVRAFVAGTIYPRHTVVQLERRNTTQEKTIAEMATTNARLTESLALANRLMETLDSAANEVSDQ